MQGSAIGEFERLLDKAFPKSPSSDDRGTLPVLEGAGQHFAGGGSPLIGEDGQFAFFKKTVSLAAIVHSWVMGADGIDDQLVFVQEIVCDVDRFLKNAAAVLP